MRIKILYCLFFMSCSICFATTTPLKEIKNNIICFLNKTEPLGKKKFEKGIPNDFIRDIRKNKSIEDGMNGIFLFDIASTHQNLHFLLIDDTGFEIINMRESFDDNLSKLVIFFKKNDEYTKEDILFYISDFIRIYHYNKKLDSREDPIL